MPDDIIFSLLEQLGAAVCLCDPTAEGCPTVFVNRAFTRLTGYERPEVVGKPCRYFPWIETGLGDPSGDSRPLDRLRPGCTTISTTRKDGAPLRARLTMGPVVDHTGEIVYLVGTLISLQEPAEAATSVHAA